MINAEVGHVDANSYVDVTYADGFFAYSVDNASWPTTDVEKEAALIEATRVLDSQFSWAGLIASETQALRWPRTEVYDADGRAISDSAVPKAIKDATCSLAYFLIQSGGLRVAEGEAKAVKVGPIDIKLAEGSETIGVPKYIAQSLTNYGSFTGVIHDSAYSVNALRS